MKALNIHKMGAFLSPPPTSVLASRWVKMTIISQVKNGFLKMMFQT